MVPESYLLETTFARVLSIKRREIIEVKYKIDSRGVELSNLTFYARICLDKLKSLMLISKLNEDCEESVSRD